MDQRLTIGTTILVGVITAGATIGGALIERGGDNPEESRDNARKVNAKSRACQDLAGALRTEAGLVGTLEGHLQLAGGVVTAKDNGFKGAWEAAHNGQTALAEALNAYVASGHDELSGEGLVTPGNGGVDELGNTLGDLQDGTTGDPEAFSSLGDWQAKLGDTATLVSTTCAP
jgi:hypothetical protein